MVMTVNAKCQSKISHLPGNTGPLSVSVERLLANTMNQMTVVTVGWETRARAKADSAHQRSDATTTWHCSAVHHCQRVIQSSCSIGYSDCVSSNSSSSCSTASLRSSMFATQLPAFSGRPTGIQAHQNVTFPNSWLRWPLEMPVWAVVMQALHEIDSLYVVRHWYIRVCLCRSAKDLSNVVGWMTLC